MYFKQIAVEGMGCCSYVIGCPRTRQDVVSIFRQFGGKFKVGSNYG